MRNLFANYIKDKEIPLDKFSAEIPKSIFISINDIRQITNDYDAAGTIISGIRIYFTMDDTDISAGFRVKGVVVPTTVDARSIIFDHKDVIMEVPVEVTPEKTVMGVSIYDFTRPCPTYCGGTTDELTGKYEN